MVGRYNYEDSRKKALETNAPEDLQALADWFFSYDSQDWNGESYDMDDGLRLFPVYDENAGDDEWDIIGWEVR